MRGLKIYLAGAMQGKSFEEMNGWRSEVKSILQHMGDYYEVNENVINPVDYYNFEEVRYQTQKEVMQYDLNHVKSSDLVIVNLDGLNTSIGSIIELYECYLRNIPVLAFGETEKYTNLHPWVKECITRFDIDLKDTCKYIADFYMK